jgi:DNA ligase-1
LELFAHLISSLDSSNSTLKKVAALKEYFDRAIDPDKVWAIALFVHKRPRRLLSTRLLREWARAYAGIDDWLFEESYQVVGDLSETISLILPAPTQRTRSSLSDLIKELIRLKDKEDGIKKEFVLDAWKSFDQNQRFVFNKLITGGFRVGVSKNLLIRSLAELNDVSIADMAYRLSGDWNPETITYSNLVLDQKASFDISRPYPFYLAYPLDQEVAKLGHVQEWEIEWKWDGIRSQLIKREGALFLWSRGEELITDKFPEFSVLLDILPDGVAIDGELLPYGDHPLPFSVLQTRLGRKNVSKNLIQKNPVKIIAYDLLEYDHEDIRNQPLEYRRSKLEGLIQGKPNDFLLFSQKVSVSDWESLSQLREESRSYYAEGFMLKRKTSAYQVGRKRGNWWKWKADPFSIDAVMIYAQKGHGRRAELFSDYTFAVWDGDNLVPFAKAYSGLTDQEMTEISRFVKSHTRERFGPVRTVDPELVFEIHFEGIQESSRHKSGIAVRFPRMHRWRKDKSAREANTLQDLKSLLNLVN